MRENPGVYKRGDIWWYQVGRGIRHSSRSTDRAVAVALREKALRIRREGVAARAGIERKTDAHAEWLQWVVAQQANSDSWLHRTYRHMRRKTRTRQWIDCLTLEELVALTIDSDGKCALTGLPFHLEQNSKRHPFAISIDRIESSRGYCADNVRLVLLAVNLAMSHWGDMAFREIARALVGRELLNQEHKSVIMNGHTVDDQICEKD